MDYKSYLQISEEVQNALKEGKPVVALESTILSHGMPYPENLQFAADMEKVIRAEGAIPATIAIIDHKLKVGLTEDDLLVMCKAENVGKVSRRDLATYLVTGQTGATTVATTMIIAALAGIKVFATGGIGGVHRGAQQTMDISADLQELAHTNVAVVSAGCKSILDIGLTLEYLETFGVPVYGYQTENFPAFYCRESGYKVDYALKNAKEAAEMIKTKWDLGLNGGVVIGNPVEEQYAQKFEDMEVYINKALQMCNEKGIRGKDTTPFLLATIKDLTGGESLATNIQLAFNNGRVAAKIAVELANIQ